ncbi:exonuclease SbcCD subunit D [Labedaea rhizosphaerae]|uniref:Nuclease SbcCD subunit D n=1 Tax=Labedaea rhizosphaerae TaxID=598644 RepID=A0A4R6SJE3_LABRH|nr:exonuclease SbcCD subunit D C-terminal domain-containing protein [Labedaea rhizosphaerae]TDQ04178.1 exodeoxyribonuclease I subunit D [Labedaea rhizosphaerae]
MRLLHTSDWHVGRTFHGRDLLAEQESVLCALAEVVVAQEVDVVLVAGDLYDRAVPAAEAAQVCDRVLAKLKAAGATIVISAGNHDSAARLGVFGQFAAEGGLHLRTAVDDLDRPVVVGDEHGSVAIYGIPYLEPETARHTLGIPEQQGHAAVLGEAMRRVRADLAGRDGTRSVVLAHAFVTGGEASASERPIVSGGVANVPASVFDGVDYVALGHLHGPQRLAEHLRYSGSPLAYSFSEARHHKSVWLVDLDETGLAGVRRHLLPVPRALATVRGELEEILADPAHESLADSYLSVELTDPVRPVDALRSLQTRFPHAVHVQWLPDHARTADPLRPRASAGLDDRQLADRFIADCRGDEPTDSERDLLSAALVAGAAWDED